MNTRPMSLCAFALGTIVLSGCNASPSDDHASSDGGVPPATPDAGNPTYGVGGEVTGLDGQLVLNLSDEELEVDEDGAFQFDAELSRGARYSVSVVTQPAGQNCSVDSGQGRVSDADVTNVEVTCTDINGALLDIALSVGQLSPAFDVETSRYRVDVPLWVDHLELLPQLVGEGVDVLVAESPFAGDAIGIELDVGPNTVTVDATLAGEAPRSYTLDVYRAPSITEELYAKARIPNESAQLGFAVAVAGDFIAAGAPGDATSARGINGDEGELGAEGSGAVYLFQQADSGWEQAAFLKAHNPDATDLFGYAVAMSGDVLVVGAPMEDGRRAGVNAPDSNELANSGAAYVFEFVEGEWQQTAYLKASQPAEGDNFGNAVATDGQRIVVGAHHESSSRIGVDPPTRDEAAINAGAAYVFERSGNSWAPAAYLKASNAEIGDQFGASVAVDGDLVMVGAPNEQSGERGSEASEVDNSAFAAGAAYVFTLDEAGAWYQVAYLKAANAREQQRFGSSVSLSGFTGAVGAFTEASSAAGLNGKANDTSAEEAGAVYLFDFDGEQWKQTDYVKASNSDASDRFGQQLALQGDTLVVAAPLEASADRGINPPENDANAPGAGAVYVFFRDADGTWAQRAYLKASNGETGDNFGHGLAFDGVTLIAGAPYEDNGKGGVDMEPSPNNTTQSAGAVYVFR